MKKVCENCKWFKPYTDPTFNRLTDVGSCHFKSPTIRHTVPVGGSFPRVAVDDFCSEFEFSGKADGEREIMGVDNGK